jgi:uncharacterized membrane protein YcgQ (UPF0703/DUF1980 family)
VKKLLFLVCVLAIGCGGNGMNTGAKNNGADSSEGRQQGGNDAKVIRDNVFIQMTNDMYLNPEDYQDQNLEIAGLIYMEDYGRGKHYYIVRKTPGCCGNDGLAGLEIRYDGAMPEDDSWVTGKGIWKKAPESTYHGWILSLYSLEKGPRGNEYLDYN